LFLCVEWNEAHEGVGLTYSSVQGRLKAMAVRSAGPDKLCCIPDFVSYGYVFESLLSVYCYFSTTRK